MDVPPILSSTKKERNLMKTIHRLNRSQMRNTDKVFDKITELIDAVNKINRENSEKDGEKVEE